MKNKFFFVFLLNSIFSLTIVSKIFSQESITTIDPWTTKERRPSSYYPMTNWGTSEYKEFTYWKRTGPNFWNVSEYMNMRLLFPVEYDSSAVEEKKYPLIVVLHGAGESGVTWTPYYNYETTDPRYDNNDHQLENGGSEHLIARNKPSTEPTHWPGFVLFPQVKYNGNWATEFDGDIHDNNRMMIEIVEMLIDSLDIDPFRIYIQGLSAGGKGVWDAINRRPDLFAAATPMSNSGDPTIMAENLAHMPIWLFQGETDNNPYPVAAENMIKALEDAGGNPRYSLYEGIGHGTWIRAFREPELYPWLLQHNALSIHAFFNKTAFCSEEEIEAKLGIAPGFAQYEWRRNGTSIENSNSHIYIATALGEYSVRIKRKNVSDEWSAWSEPVAITLQEAISPPVITAKGSTALPGLDGSNNVTLQAPDGYSHYEWSGGKAGQYINVSEAGEYTLTVTEVNGCKSEPSEPIFVTVNSPASIASPTNIIAQSTSESTINLFWTDNATSETGYEIYRATASGGPYEFVTLTLKNKTFYADSSLLPNINYYYILRAISNEAVSEASEEVSAATLNDIEAPSPPLHLRVTNSTETTIGLKWDASMDNVYVEGYIIYRNGEAIDTVYSTLTYTDNPLPGGTTYSYFIKSFDISKNVSARSNQIVGKTEICGLSYSYFEGAWSTLPDFNSLTPLKTGIIDNFLIDDIYDVEDNFAIKFDGQIHILTSGNYTFYTRSDDGSKLYINGEEVVNNDGVHGTRERSGTIYLSNGTHNITVTYFEGTGAAEVLEVAYSGPDFAKRAISSDLLCFTGENDNIKVPTSLAAIPLSQESIKISWKDNADNEDGYEIYSSQQPMGQFDIIATTEQNQTSFVHEGLNPSSTYYYKIKAVSNKGESNFSTYQQNLKYSYYPILVQNLNEPMFTGIEPEIEGYIDNFYLSPATKSTNFAFKFEGKIKIQKTGEYSFYSMSDDGSKIFINGVAVVDNDKDQPFEGSKVTGRILLEKGEYPIVVGYRQKTSGYGLEIGFSGPDFSEQIIPDHLLNMGIASATTLDDTEEPTAPTHLQLLSVSSTGMGISWTASTDNIAVVSYSIYHYLGDEVDSVLTTTSVARSVEFGTNNTISTYLDGLNPGTSYQIIVRAHDAAGNISSSSNLLEVTTPEKSEEEEEEENPPLGIDDPSGQSGDIMVFPNPTNYNNIFVRISGPDDKTQAKVKIMDVVGRIYFSTTASTKELIKGYQVSAKGGISPGVYLILVEKENQILTSKFIIKK